MNEQIKYFGMSAGLHSAAFMLIIALAMDVVAQKKVVTIDFSLNESPSLYEPRQTKHQKSEQPVTLPTKPEVSRQLVEQPASPTSTVSSPAAPVKQAAQPVNAALQTVVASGKQRVEGSSSAVAAASVSNVTQTSTATISNSASGESGIEQVQKKYLKEHFNYIRELIIKRLDYPLVARRMEWTGKVVLAFVVSDDGGVHSIEVKEGSGHAVLDNSAMDIVKRASPFPKPPVAVKIVMPVHFKLQ